MNLYFSKTLNDEAGYKVETNYITEVQLLQEKEKKYMIYEDVKCHHPCESRYKDTHHSSQIGKLGLCYTNSVDIDWKHLCLSSNFSR